MQRLKHLMAAILIAATAFVCSGCGAILLGGAAAAGTYVYMDGQAEREYSAPLKAVFNASLSACKALGIPVTSSSLTNADGSIKGDYGSDPIWITMEQNGNLVKVKVRVGLLGNENNSRRIHNAIAQRL